MKKFSAMDVIAMKMQEMGKDRFLLGMSKHGDTAEELINDVIKSLKDYLEEHKDTIKGTNPPYGFRINCELFEKGEEMTDKYK